MEIGLDSKPKTNIPNPPHHHQSHREEVPHSSNHNNNNHSAVADRLYYSYTSAASSSSNYQPTYVYSTQPHASPLVHTLHSEWIDSPSNSPSKMSYTRVYETPSKSKPLNFITPISDRKDKSESISTQLATPISPQVQANMMLPAQQQTSDHQNTTASTNNNSNNASTASITKKKVQSMDIFWSMLNDIVGKDKMAKFGQYALRLLIHWADKSEAYLSDESINFKSINARYNNREKKLNLFMNFLKHPQNFIRIIVILVCSLFSSRFAGMVKGLSLYRQFLRFGKTPFRVRGLFNKLADSVSIKQDADGSIDVDVAKFQSKFLTKATLGDMAGLYYGFNDETLLLYKLNLLSNKSFHKFAIRHESLAWYYDTLLGLFNAYQNLQSLASKEMELKIQIQVKSRSRVLTKQLLGGTVTSVSANDAFADDKDKAKLKEIQFKKTNAYLDIYKGLSDFIFNSYTVFRTPLPFATLQIWMGISASSFSILKLYRETKKRLEGS